MALGTLRQFERAHRDKAVADYGITGAEYDRAYPAGCRRGEWFRAAEEYVRGGNTLTRIEADALDREGVNVLRLAHGYAIALPVGYLTPDVRTANAEAPRLYARNR